MVESGLYELILDKKPLEVWRKGIKGMVLVRILDPFDDRLSKVKEVILRGEENSPEARIGLFSKKEVAFFREANRKAIEDGLLVLVTEEGEQVEDKVEAILDEDIEKRMKGNLNSFKRFLSEFATNTNRLSRVLTVAQRLDLPQSKIDLLKAKAAELGMNIEL